MKKLFGTDGMRGEAGRFPLDAQTVRTIGRSLARQLAERAEGVRAPRIIVGRDTRESGAWIESAFLEGARAAGAACESAGVITTPGVAYLARTLPADAGVVVSASHNPYEDNGIKIFAPTGRKLDDATERLIEADIQQARGDVDSDDGGAQRASASNAETATQSFAGAEAKESAPDVASVLQARYLDYLAEEVAAGLRLEGLRLVVDCANGAASHLAPALFARLGAQVLAVGNAPDGRNINRECGSLYVERLGERVVAAGADLGVAFDGDADRALFVDGRGAVVDGDATLWVMAKNLLARGELAGRRVVATVMSNIGLELALGSLGVEMRRADVGDKYVLEELLRTGGVLGGEQSGHIIFPRVSLAGDGMMTTLFLLRAMREAGESLEALSAGFTRYPQVLVNVRVAEKRPFQEVAEIEEEARRTEAALAGQGRLLLRYSGTEPLARVMIEGPRQDEIERLAQHLAAVIGRALGDGKK
ncbi:MAG TPA: phosphoglucosamine mutase [Pyrinomonadaceae bacterium]|nr:phosphoglucosamine mutase [Pyrinomonadaceae bacterium]